MTDSNADPTLGQSSDDIQWRTSVLTAIYASRWDDVQVLLLERRVVIAKICSRLLEERGSQIEAWRLQTQRLPRRDYVRLLKSMQRTTLGYVKPSFTALELAPLWAFLTRFQRVIARLATILLLAGAAAIAHPIVASRIELALSGALRRYIALVVFLGVYRILATPVEALFDRVLTSIRQRALCAEAEHLYVDAVLANDWLDSLVEVRKTLGLNSETTPNG